MTIALPNGNIISYDYDEANRLIAVDDNIGVIAEYTYDANGNKLSETDGEERTVRYAYDALNRKISETLPSGAQTQYAYDNNSNLLNIVDALGNTTQYTYNSLNQQLSQIDALNAKTTFEYDAVGNLVKATDANGNPTTWTYDALNRNTHITFADGLSRQYGYDAVGNMTSSIDRAGNKFSYTYNALGMLLTKSYPDKTQDSYTYDAIGQMLSAVNPDANVSFAYDGAGRLTRETLNGKNTSYAYDVAAGKRTLTYPSGMKIVENLNARDLISSILQNGTEIVTMQYDESGRKSSMTYANGITTDYSYNANGWLSQINAAENILNLAFIYDATGNIIKRQNKVDDSHTESYGYDAISQLVSFKRGETVDNSYQFDPLGNRTKVVENGVTTNYTSNRINAYTAISGGLNFTPQYDANGNLLNSTNHHYRFNLNNQLSSVDSEHITYKYDALGRLVSKTRDSNTISYYYAGIHLIESYLNNKKDKSYLYELYLHDSMFNSYITYDFITDASNDRIIKPNITQDKHIIDEIRYHNIEIIDTKSLFSFKALHVDDLIMFMSSANTYYCHADQLGSIIAITSNSGVIKERVCYNPWGRPSFNNNNTNSDTSIIGNNFLFAGRPYDYDCEIYNFRARNLNSNIGRFVQKDPLLFYDGHNDYAYVHNSPIVYVDPLGLFGCEWAGDYADKGAELGMMGLGAIGMGIGAGAGFFYFGPMGAVGGAALGGAIGAGAGRLLGGAIGYGIGAIKDIGCVIKYGL